MDLARFWKIIGASRLQAAGDRGAQIEALREALTQLSADEVASFQANYCECTARADTNPVYCASAIIDGFYMSDDAFEYFRDWLISHGESIFENALRDPETLSEVAGIEEDCEFEEFGYVAPRIWEEKTGLTMDQMPMPEPSARPEERDEPAWKDDAELMRRFPKLWAKFSDDAVQEDVD